MTREPIEVTRQDRIYCLKASSDYHRELCEECRFYPNCDHMTQDDMTELTIKDLEALEQEPTTKNDLEVDWESYKDVDGNSLDDLILEVLQNNFDCGNTYGYKVADEIIGLLPSVTPQKSKTGYLSIDDVMSVFDDFMRGDADEEDTETFLKMLKDKVE